MPVAISPNRVGIAWRPDASLWAGGRFYLAYNNLVGDYTGWAPADHRGHITMDMTDGGFNWIGPTRGLGHGFTNRDTPRHPASSPPRHLLTPY